MAWSYSDYVTYDVASAGSARLTRLRLHIQEVSDTITAEASSGGQSMAARERRAYLDGLKQEESALAAALGVATPASARRTSFVRARPIDD